jgi:uncharacterized protein (DUF1501 family)
MLHRRQFLERTLKGSSLIALSTVVPNFVLNTARAAQQGKDNILVVIELNGGNDGLNTVIPHGDDLYHKYRATLRHTKNEIVRIDDYHGLNPGMGSLQPMLGKGELAIVQGVGYPNPDRSHFESMDIWQMADPTRKIGTGWLGRSVGHLKIQEGGIAGMYVGSDKLPTAMEGAALGTPTLDPKKPYELQLEGGGKLSAEGQNNVFKAADTVPGEPAKKENEPPSNQHREARMKLIRELTETGSSSNDLLQFVRRSSIQTYTALEGLKKLMEEDRQNRQPPQFDPFNRGGGTQLVAELDLIARVIRAGFGTRIFYVSMGSFDTHANQRQQHQNLLAQLANGISSFFQKLEQSGDAKRVMVMTFSEFGRRVQENGSKGTDHGAASCMFVAGPAVKGGLIGKHPSLAKDDLDSGDLKHHTDFRQVYATLLDKWLLCDSQQVLGGKFGHLELVKPANGS